MLNLLYLYAQFSILEFNQIINSVAALLKKLEHKQIKLHPNFCFAQDTESGTDFYAFIG